MNRRSTVFLGHVKLGRDVCIDSLTKSCHGSQLPNPHKRICRKQYARRLPTRPIFLSEKRNEFSRRLLGGEVELCLFVPFGVLLAP